MTKPLRILLYYADTGGGHRATAQALAEGLTYRYGEAVDPILLDGLRKYVPGIERYCLPINYSMKS